MEQATKDAFMRLNNRIKTLEESSANNKPEVHPERSEEVGALLKSLLNAQKEFERVPENGVSKVGGREIRYSTLKDMLEIVLPPLNNNDIVLLLQGSTDNNSSDYVYIKLYHAPSEQWIGSRMALIYDPNSRMNQDQSRGSSMTYTKRYLLSSTLGLRCGDFDADQEAFAKDNKTAEDLGNCPECNKYLVKKPKFIGCSGWKPNDQGCNYKKWINTF